MLWLPFLCFSPGISFWPLLEKGFSDSPPVRCGGITRAHLAGKDIERQTTGLRED